jgi:glycosyltransferase involved in cell wall biosynthesis
VRICLFTSDFVPNIGGVAAHVYGLARGLAMLGHQVKVVYTVPDAAGPPYETTAGFEVHRISLRPHPLLPVRFLRLWRVMSQVEALMRQAEVQVLHWHTIRPEGIVSKMIRQPGMLKVFTNHTSGYLEMIQTPVGRRKARFHLGHAAGIIAPSLELAEASQVLNVPRTRIFVIPNGVDVERFRPASPDRALLEKLEVEPGTRIVLCPRRLVPKNGVRYLAEAIPLVVTKFDEVRFLIVGDGEAREKELIQQLLAQANVTSRVTLTGAVPNAEMPAFYNLADIAVLPSLVEATSIAGLEAMASGCPLVGTRVGGIPTLIEEGETGYLVPPADPQSLAEAILVLLQDKEQRARMGSAARKRAESMFSWPQIAQQTVEAYVALGVVPD